MLWIILTAGICVTGCYSLITRPENFSDSTWNAWSSCSKSCGDGVQQRSRGGEKDSKHCFLQFCPSYLSWPRIHFSGPFTLDSNTVNNIRCAYENEHFSASQLSKQYISLEEEEHTHVYYKKKSGNWNPGGSNQIYFSGTYVTAFCTAPGTCVTNASIVGLEMTEAARGVVAVLDVDWQYAIEIWAWRIRIPGVLEADYVSSSQHVEIERVVNVTRKDYGYAHPLMTRYKSKLVNITWNDKYYKKMFKNATELSINFVIDLFNHYSYQGRLSGTIGLTSPDDAKEVMATRTIRPTSANARENAPFFIYQDKRIMTLDFGMSIVGRDDGRILSSDTGQLDLAILIPREVYCKFFSEDRATICAKGLNPTDLISKSLTTEGELSKRIGDDAVWYLTYGGVMDIDLKHLDNITWLLLQNSRVAVMEQNNGVEMIYMSEFPKGIVIGIKDSQTIRLNPRENVTWQTFVSSFGKPANNTEVELFVVDRSNANTECERPSCNLTTGVPRNALRITPANPRSVTNASGLVTFTIQAVNDPGNVRGCGLDGQIYPLRMLAKYKTGKKFLTFSESGLNTTGKPADFPSQTLAICARIYNSVEEKHCPTWNDVKDIFIQYYNLYPVMWNVGIIDLHSYKDIRRKSSMLKVSMFEYDFNNPRYMPVSRDLSAGKKNLIGNWLKCGMRQFDPSQPKEKKTEKATQQCTKEFVKREIEEIRVLLSNAVLFELSTVPPYVTAWLSLKTEYGRNKEIADIIESVFNEEMLHMSLSANVLNAIGGRVELTDDSKLPIYPTILASGASYQLSPNIQVAIEPFSIGLVENIFAGVETPADRETRQVFYILAKIWEGLPKSDLRTSRKMQLLLREMHIYSGFDEASEHMENDESENLGDEVSQLNIWEKLKKNATDALTMIKKKLGKTVGALYARISLRLTVVECCLKIAHLESIIKKVDNIFPSSSIFNGNQSFQLNQSHWYQENSEGLPESLNVSKDNESPSNVSLIRPPLFDVVDLSSALESMVEIVYQGEGGSECSPFVTDPDIYASYRGREAGFENSHYYRFQEIAHGKRLIKIENPPTWSNVKCLDASLCPSLLKANESYCYAGESIPFYEDGVWPILSNPLDENYDKGSRVYQLNHQFNLLYTRLLFCLQDTFGGQPFNIKTCMTIMYDLTIAGKHLVQMPLRVLDDTTTFELGSTGTNGSPTWRFVREVPNRAGLPLRVSRTMT